MKRSSVILLLVVALIAVAWPAMGAKPDCAVDLNHPSCRPVSTTTTSQVPSIGTCEAQLVLGSSGVTRFDCDWSPTFATAATSGVINVSTVSGELTHLVVFVRDSSPGDICVLEQRKRPIAPEFEASFPLRVGDESYWDTPTHWCSRFDPVDGTRADLNGDPLHLSVSIRAKRGTVVEVSLTPEPTT